MALRAALGGGRACGQTLAGGAVPERDAAVSLAAAAARSFRFAAGDAAEVAVTASGQRPRSGVPSAAAWTLSAPLLPTDRRARCRRRARRRWRR